MFLRGLEDRGGRIAGYHGNLVIWRVAIDREALQLPAPIRFGAGERLDHQRLSHRFDRHRHDMKEDNAGSFALGDLSRHLYGRMRIGSQIHCTQDFSKRMGHCGLSMPVRMISASSTERAISVASTKNYAPLISLAARMIGLRTYFSNATFAGCFLCSQSTRRCAPSLFPLIPC